MKMRYLVLMVLWLVPAECMERSMTMDDVRQAIRANDQEAVQWWIAKVQAGNVGVNATLSVAASMGYVEIVRELLKVPEIDVNTKSQNGWTALMWAARAGHVAVVIELLKVPGIEVNVKSQTGWTALIEAARRGHVAVVIELLKAPGIEVNAKNQNGLTALTEATSEAKAEVVRELLKAPGIEAINVSKALMVAVKLGDLKVVREFLKIPGIAANAQDNNGHSALTLAIEQSRDQVALLLWAVGVQEVGISALSPEMQKAKKEGTVVFDGIVSALETGDFVALKSYANGGFSLIVKTPHEYNALHIAVIHNQPEFAKYLIEYNKHWLRERGKDGFNPLDLMYGHWVEENEQWNSLILELPREFTPDVEKAKREWEVFKETAFKEGCEGMPGFSSERTKGEKES